MLENDGSHKQVILVEGAAWDDSEFYARWLLAASKANDLLCEAKRDDPEFCEAIEILETMQELNYEAQAMTFLCLLRDEFVTFVFDFDSEDLLDFMLMTEMGFFTISGDRYQMTLPSKLDMETLKQSHLKVAERDDEDWCYPERYVATIPCAEAAKYQLLLREMRPKQRLADRELLLFSNT